MVRLLLLRRRLSTAGITSTTSTSMIGPSKEPLAESDTSVVQSFSDRILHKLLMESYRSFEKTKARIPKP